LPTIASLIKEGVSASLKSLPGYKSPALWSSIATGKIPEKTGILYFSNLFLEIPKLKVKKDLTKKVIVDWPYRVGKLFSKDKKKPSRIATFSRKAYVYSMLKYGKLFEKAGIGGNYLVTGAFRTEKTIWEILSEEGLKVNVVGWLTTWPAEKVNGIIVSQKAMEGLSKIYQNPEKFKSESDNSRITYPGEILEQLKAFNKAPPSIGGEEIQSFFNSLNQAETEQIRSMHFDRKNRFNFFSQLYLSDIFSTKTSIYLRDKYQPDFITVYLPGLDGIQHIFWHYHLPQEFPFLKLDRKEITKFENVIKNYYKFLDQQVAELIKGFDTVIILSDHGMESIPEKHFDHSAIRSGQHEDSPEGILIMKGPQLKKNAKLPEAHIFDIAPTILYLLGKDVDANMDGEVLTEAVTGEFLKNNPIQKKDYGQKKSSNDSFYEQEEQEKVKERLKALGYLD